MSEEIRVRQQPQAQPTGAMMPEVRQRASMLPWIILGVVVLVVVVLAIVFRNQLFKSNVGGTAMNNATVKTQTYQAVFLTNGQVYFGNITSQDKEYMTLKDIYYLQVGPQQGSGTSANAQQSISLVKLGNELHGPVDEMHISKGQILFYEDLKNDGNVVSAILKDKTDKAAAPAK